MKLLVVEDDPGIARMLKRGLTQSGFTVDEAQDGRQGLALAEENSYGIILLDVMLAGAGRLAGVRAFARGWQPRPHSNADRPRRSGGPHQGLRLGGRPITCPSPLTSASCWPASAPSCAGTKCIKPAYCMSPTWK